MLVPGRLPLNEAEGTAIQKLVAKHDSSATLTRRDPSESGPVLVHIGDDTWLVSETGKVSKQRKKA